jgi:ABC-type thiamin/hydroxymethylpyrimidine transport system permease subunit
MAKKSATNSAAPLVKPGMVTMAAVFAWAAVHEPARFTPASCGVWLLGALTTALLVRAAMALISPLAAALAAALGQAFGDAPNGGGR